MLYGKDHPCRFVAASSDSLPRRDKRLAAMSLATTAKLYPVAITVAAVGATIRGLARDASEAIVTHVYNSRASPTARKEVK